jgi:hypothetical protein
MSIDGIQREDWGAGGEHRGPVPVTVHTQHGELPSPEQVLNEIKTQNAPSPATAQLAEPDATASPVTTKSTGKLPDWGSHSQEVGVPGEQADPQAGLAPSFLNYLARQPGSFEENAERFYQVAFDIEERSPRLSEEYSGWPASLQSKANKVLFENVGADIETLYRKLKPGLTLDEAAAADRSMRRLRK